MSSKTGQPLVGVEDYQKEAARRLPKNALDFYQTGALDQETLLENKEAMKRYEGKGKGGKGVLGSTRRQVVPHTEQ